MMNKNNKVLIILIAVCIFMFAFSFAMIPFYNVLCKVFGINGKTYATMTDPKIKVDQTRSVSIVFLANDNAQSSVNFYPETKKIKIHPGEIIKMFYVARNTSNTTVVTQAIPSVTPGGAAKYFKKIECFCFQKQTFLPRQTVKMPVIFYIDPSLPKNIHDIALSYAMFQVNSVR